MAGFNELQIGTLYSRASLTPSVHWYPLHLTSTPNKPKPEYKPKHKPNATRWNVGWCSVGAVCFNGITIAAITLHQVNVQMRYNSFPALLSQHKWHVQTFCIVLVRSGFYRLWFFWPTGRRSLRLGWFHPKSMWRDECTDGGGFTLQVLTCWDFMMMGQLPWSVDGLPPVAVSSGKHVKRLTGGML